MNASKPQISLAEQAYIKLEEMIVTMRLAPGAALAEATLSEQLGIGRTPIREALHRLARERLITILPQRGIIVSDINVGNQLKVLEVRRELERLIARSAARRADEQQINRFRELAAQLEEAARSNDSDAFMNYDREFNQLSSMAARNEFLTGAVDLINSLSRRFWFAHFQRFADMPRAARLHANVALAIANRDAAGAAAASDALLDYIEKFTRDTLAEGL